MEKKIPTTFVGEIAEELTQVSPEISKTRLRIFYKGFNRNQGYITDEFAEKLLSSLPYTPVVGIFNDLVKDFGGHNQDRNVAKIYGVVPQDPHFAWEDHLDSDGVTRTYACTDVYLFTGRYDAAKLIPGKQQSMELDTKTIRGDWQVINEYGQEGFVYTDAQFIGLSVLGDDKTPCFEGSAFYELVSQFNDFMAAKTSNGGNDMALEITKPVGGSNQVESEIDATPAESSDPSTEQTEDTTDSTPSNESAAETADETPDGDSATDDKKDEESTDGKKDEEKPADSESNPDEDKKEEDKPTDSACKDKKADAEKEENKSADSACGNKKEDAEAQEKKEEDKSADSACGNKKTDAEAQEKEKKEEDKPADSELTPSNFENLNNKILELNQQLATYEAEANKFKNLYTALKADYDVLVAEKNKELAAQKDAKLQEYTTYISDAVKQDFESRLDSYSTVDELEKDLLFAAKPSLFAKHDDFAPTSTDEDSEDELAALIKKSMKH